MKRSRHTASASSVLLVLVCAASFFPGSSARAAQPVPLPTEADVVAFAPGAETILYGRRGIETLLPGPVDDDEVVDVAVAPDGTPVEVAVKQRLDVHGLGDFRFKVSGPAQTVEALPGSESEPGLRKGSVLWQGFSDGSKLLASRMLLFPDQEATRLPLRVSLEHTVAGAQPEGPASGPMSLRLSVSNESADPVTMTSATGDPAELARVLDAIATRLAAGDRPRPGEGGIPTALTAAGGERTITRSIPASFHVRGELTFESGALDGAETRGGTLRTGAVPTVEFEGFVGGGRAAAFDVSLRGTARDLGRPVLRLSARPAPPPAEHARPPGGGSWSDLVAAGEVTRARPLWDRIMNIAWSVAKLRQFDTYLGNPDPTGVAETVFRYRLAALAAPLPPPAADGAPPLRATPMLQVSALLALLLLAFDGVLLWSLL